MIDLDDMLVGNAKKFLGETGESTMKKLFTINTAKAFPNNIEVEFEIPAAHRRLRTLHYSISLIPENESCKPRKADERLGYFTTYFHDFVKY